MKIINQYLKENLPQEYERMQQDRDKVNRIFPIYQTKEYPEAYKRAKELIDLWYNSPQGKKCNSMMSQKYPMYNGGEDTYAAINMMYNSMHNHPDINKRELRNNEEMVRMILGDTIT